MRASDCFSAYTPMQPCPGGLCGIVDGEVRYAIPAGLGIIFSVNWPRQPQKLKVNQIAARQEQADKWTACSEIMLPASTAQASWCRRDMHRHPKTPQKAGADGCRVHHGLLLHGGDPALSHKYSGKRSIPLQHLASSAGCRRPRLNRRHPSPLAHAHLWQCTVVSPVTRPGLGPAGVAGVAGWGSLAGLQVGVH